MILLFIAVEIWVFGALCAWFSARTMRGKNVVTIVAFGVAALGVLTVEMARRGGASVFDMIL